MFMNRHGEHKSCSGGNEQAQRRTMLALALTMFAFTRCQTPVMLQSVNKWVERPAPQVSLSFRAELAGGHKSHGAIHARQHPNLPDILIHIGGDQWGVPWEVLYDVSLFVSDLLW